MRLGTVKESQEFFEILFEAGNGFGRQPLPAALPLTEGGDSLSSVGRLVDEFGLFQTGSLGGFEFVFQVAQLVRPAALVGDARPKPLASRSITQH